jgi:cytochrome c-type biogenesis protein CcsB
MMTVEHAFMAWQPFRIAWIVYFLACAAFAMKLGTGSKKLQVAGFALMCVGFAAHLGGVGMRAYVAQRAPWADLYEAMVVVALMCVTFAVVFEALHRTAYVGLSASFMAGVGLVGAAMLPFDFRTIDPLVPVLRSWWLKYHVLSMICSYGAFSLAFGISGIHLYQHFARKDAEASRKLEDLTYRVVQVGFFFITVGIILGAVWADSAWGRYWGWDPKEIWALVSWFIYGAYIHGRMIGWCRGIRAAYASVIGYAAILFTFFGVNFVLTGLHSYANPS